MLGWMRAGLGLIVGLYLATLGVALGAIFLSPTQTGWPALLRELSHLLFVPAPILLVFAAIVRARVTLLGLTALLLAFSYCYGPRLLPREVSSQQGPGFRILTFNLGASRGLAPAHGTLRTIETSNSDVVCLVEARADTLSTVWANVQAAYPYQASSNGIFVLSRFPLTDTQTGIVPSGAKDSLQTTLEVDHRLVTVTVVHLGRVDSYSGIRAEPRRLVGAGRAFSTDVRDEAVRGLQHLIRADGGSQILVGDLNMTPTSQAYQVLTTDLRDAFSEAGWGLGHTYPATLRIIGADLSLPAIRIDYILHSSDLVATRAWVGPNGGSDHLPLNADLAFR